MEGYSVTEAASILGVPTERVWELLARGVLAGTPEGETGMRVFLQPRPAPAPVEPSRPNGNGGADGREPDRELSPFRELLTEFRNLTERYGQALLALGEARGEVAALRSRVDLLEARMDLRLTSDAGPMPAPWPRPNATPEPAATPAPGSVTPPSERGSTGTAETVSEETVTEAESELRSARRSAARRATESFAEALARADDPSVPDLPGGQATADALSVFLSDPTTTDDPAVPEATLPRELPPADEVPVADESSEDAVAGEVVEEESSTGDDTPQPEPILADEEPSDEEASAPAEPVAEETAEAEEGVASTSEQPAASTVTAEVRQPDEPVAPEIADEPATAEEPDAGEPAWRDERYTAEITEPDWYEAEAFPLDEPRESEGPGEPATGAAAEPGEPASEAVAGEVDSPPEADPRDEVSEAATPNPRAPRPTERATVSRLRSRSGTSRDEETVLWFGRSPERAAGSESGDAEEMEVAPTGRPGEASGQPRSRELDDALAALDALARSASDPTVRRDVGPSASRPTATDASREPGEADRARPVTPAPASRAYRRLRRIFPG